MRVIKTTSHLGNDLVRGIAKTYRTVITHSCRIIILGDKAQVCIIQMICHNTDQYWWKNAEVMPSGPRALSPSIALAASLISDDGKISAVKDVFIAVVTGEVKSAKNITGKRPFFTLVSDVM